MNNSIKPGQVWRDTDGKRIQAHGAAIFYENETFYWYGENKEFTDGKSAVWTWGIRFYSSKDMYNWKDEGIVIPPVTEDTSSPLHPEKRIDRPHILYNDRTKKYILWFKTSGDCACFTIMTAESLLGPYQVVKDMFRPLEKRVGDFDLAKDDLSGRAYLYFDGDHSGMTTVELTEDYLDVWGRSTVDFAGLQAPFCREGMSHFERGGLHYMLTSGMSGYIPNPSEAAVSRDWFGPFTVQGNPHVNDKSDASFNSQISAVFKHPGKRDLYIALADRWVPDFQVTQEVYGAMVRAIGAHFEPDKYKPTQEDRELLRQSPMLEAANTSMADYVWLPLRFEGERVYMDWKDEWCIEEYE